jgi:PhnB protein
MKTHPYLSFNGQCAEAFRYYEKLLGGRVIAKMTWGESPMANQAPPEWSGKIMHAHFEVDGHSIAGADAPPGQYVKPQGMCVTLDFADPAEADRAFAGLTEGGTTQMPIQETFWAKRFGMAIDKFGIPWMINCSKPM